MLRKRIKTFMIGIGVMAAAIGIVPAKAAHAANGDYCREYTRTAYIGGRPQETYGTACLQPDGSWMIVGEGYANDIPNNVSNVEYIIHDNRREVVPPRVVYYRDYPPPYRYYRQRTPAPTFVCYHNGIYRDGVFVSYKDRGRHRGWYKHGRDDDHDHDYDYDHGRGHGWHH